MTKFIKIFKVSTKETSLCEVEQLQLDLVVKASLNNEDFNSLTDYFIDNTPSNSRELNNQVLTIDIKNTNELLEDSPLPNGTVIRDTLFIEGGRYIIVLGNDENGIRVTIKL